MTTIARRREVVYTLSATRTRLDDPNVVLVPVATYSRYVDALADSKAWHGKRGWVRVIQRHSMGAA